jgi:Tfp pilus assembly protein PilO
MQFGLVIFLNANICYELQVSVCGVIWKKAFITQAKILNRLNKTMIQENNQRKVVGRKVALALGLVCIILAAGLVGVLAIYLTNNTNADEITSLKAENAYLQGNVTSLTNQLTSLQNSYSQLYNQYQSLSTQNSDYEDLANYTAYLTNILQLGASIQYLQNQEVQMEPNSSTTILDTATINSPLQYAGYFTVQASSSSNTTYVQIQYYYAGRTFSNSVVIGEGDTAALPTLPGEFSINLGNTEATDTVNATVTVVYFY